MRMTHRDRDADLLDGERSEAVLDGDVARAESVRRLAGDGRELAERHLLVGGVVDSTYGTAFVHLTHRAKKEDHGAVGRRRYPAQHVERIDRCAHECRRRSHPPATGGMSAISSPSRTTSVA